MKFGAIAAFLAAWTIVVYPLLAHMVWGGEGSLVGDMIGALDFAGGDVVHISSGLTALVLALMVGRRHGFGAMSYRPHNVPFIAPARRCCGLDGSASTPGPRSPPTAWRRSRW